MNGLIRQMPVSVPALQRQLREALDSGWKLKDENIALREKVEELEEMLRQKRDMSRQNNDALFFKLNEKYKLTPIESNFFLFLCRRGEAKNDVIYSHLYDGINNPPQMQVIKVIVRSLRKKIAKIDITTIFKLGYRLENAAEWRKKLEELVNEAAL